MTTKEDMYAQEKMTPEMDKYTDAFQISHKPDIFQLNFGYYLPRDNASWHTRLWASPRSIKSIYNVLKRNIEAFEEKYGKIPEPKAKEGSATYGRAHGIHTIEVLPEDMPKGGPLTKREG